MFHSMRQGIGSIVSVLVIVVAIWSASCAYGVTPGPTTKVVAGEWIPALSSDGQTVLLAKSAHGSAVGPLELWSASTKMLRRTPVVGAPLEVSNNGRSVTADCGGTICFWNGSSAHVRRVDLRAFCPDPTQTYRPREGEVVTSPGGRFAAFRCQAPSGIVSVLVRIGASRPRRVALLPYPEIAAISADGATIIVKRGITTKVIEQGKVRATFRGDVIATSPTAKYVIRSPLAEREAGPAGRQGFKMYDTRTGQTSSFSVICPTEIWPCFAGGASPPSEDGRLFVARGDSSIDASAGTAWLVDAQMGTVTSLSQPDCSLTYAEVSLAGRVAEYACVGRGPEAGVYVRTVG
jgi:hypothetical protein